MSKSLVIVESPAKAKTIKGFLGEDYVVTSSMGHLIDLPSDRMGVDIEHDFKPEFEVVKGRDKILRLLKKEAKTTSKIYIATDPDREGEAIGWHIKNNLQSKKSKEKKEFLRVVFHEITKDAILESFRNPGEIDLNKVNSQQARRVLDRVVGYLLSPLLWKKITRGLSAGRVQSVALRLIVDREKEVLAFVPQEYWEIEAELSKKSDLRAVFVAKLDKKNDEKIDIKDKDTAQRITEELKTKDFIVSDVSERQLKKNPQAPFITSTIQQEAFNKLGFNANKTMMIAQQLYEGIELGSLGTMGLITYMRTDSTKVSDEAIKKVRSFILKNFGKEYLPESANIYKSRKSAQEAHEAIRPTLVDRDPDDIKAFLSPEQFKLYTLIHNRFVASQMKPAISNITTVEIKAGEYLFRASGSQLVFNGFSAVYNIDENSDKNTLPDLKKDELLNLINLLPSDHFTKPPARFSDASLGKALEEDGIGRPSTYAPIISTIVARDYVRRLKGYLFPTELGIKVCDMLVANFSKIMDIGFTALMEEELDEVEEGKMEWVKVLKDFYGPFKEALDKADKSIKKEVILTGDICELCGKPMMIKWGKRGKFLSCSGFPACKNAKSITTKVKCPAEGCGGELVERRSRRGVFYGCSNFPKCRYIASKLPSPDENAITPSG